MTIKELEEKMKELAISENRYSIMVDLLPDEEWLPSEEFCIVKKNTWQVYYSERGNKSGLKCFQSESEACDYFYKEMYECEKRRLEFESNK